MRRLREDLLGGDFDELIEEAPLSRFVVGVLHPDLVPTASPQDEEVVDGLDDEEAEAGSTAPDAQADPGVALSRLRWPRSVGLTFAMAERTSATVTVTATRYLPVSEEPEVRWKREQIGPLDIALDVSTAKMARSEPAPGLELRALIREPREGTVAVTMTLINTQRAQPGERDAFCWFDPSITITAEPDVLRPRPAAVVAGLDEDETATQQLLFRGIDSFAVGHACAAVWDARSGEVGTIRTTFVPDHEMLLSEPSGLGGPGLGMDALADSPDLAALDDLITDYESWIDGLASAADASEGDAQTLARHRQEAQQAAERMRAGLDLLRTDRQVRSAFDLMNRAMAQQRSRQSYHRGGGRGAAPTTADATWYPFQIAFILLNLRGVAQEDSPDREIADLLWFPTGGGKTEAYLGIIGMAILLRRIRDPRSAGVSVLMRYTLRLLTLQQYQRAAGLICALEVQRRLHLPDAAPISIGLWVGQGSTPNRIDDARAALRRAIQGLVPEDEKADPVQIRQCPWCGGTLDAQDYQILDRSRMVVSCRDTTCDFRGGLPVHIVDDDIYRELPSLVIATVDKLAMLPWKRETGALLKGGVDLADGFTSRAPDLVVQDELHLISGPLGSVVGLYETAVDALSTESARPKLVASTATIRRATDQVKAVFDRQARQFPPPGASHSDSYFARQADRGRKSSRMYAGVMAPGASHATLMIRVYASLLQSASCIVQDDDTADLYWTLLAYFNSLRVLGGAYIQVLDDVPIEIGAVAGRRDEIPRKLDDPREMTSRKSSAEIPHELEVLERKRGEDEAADVVLATNMISVGVDVDRLGLMTVMGQPQSTSEYIQATSRVGRRDPGLVVAIYNAARSRDLSHYENFAAYHRMLYRHVEATSATPFAPRARDRALHAVVVALVRHGIPELAPSRAAGDAVTHDDDIVARTRLIAQRALNTMTEGVATDGDAHQEEVEKEVDDLVDEWLAAQGLTVYEGWFGRWKDGSLLVPASDTVKGSDDAHFAFPPASPPWPTLTSMRDVDAESKVYVIPGHGGRGRRSSREA
ncbi:helicase-related protein [Serinicoccus marinus]|uniref:helicase-related protein n=1 Tax=Serinicoccus marinus TaxID=247333 RepID=UPI0024917632|nr:helicase-related protein [Serinicoccus marinus]